MEPMNENVKRKLEEFIDAFEDQYGDMDGFVVKLDRVYDVENVGSYAKIKTFKYHKTKRFKMKFD